METYTKVHKTAKAANAHVDRIIKRGGHGTAWEEANSFFIEYYFPDAKNKQAKARQELKKEMMLDVLSPDGFTIRLDDQDFFNSIEEAKAYFHQWKKRYEAQGYYSANYGRIELKYLMDECSVVKVLRF